MHGGNGVASLAARGCSGYGLAGELQSIFGANLVGLWIGEDMVVDGSNNVTLWPGRVGSTLVPSTAGVYRTLASVNGHRGHTDANKTVARSLRYPGTSPARLCTFAVASVTTPFPAGGDHLMAGSASQWAISGQALQSLLISATSPTHYVDGIQTHAITTGTRVIIATHANDAGVFETGGLVGYAAYNALLPVLCAGIVSSAPNATQISQATTALKAYYGTA